VQKWREESVQKLNLLPDRVVGYDNVSTVKQSYQLKKVMSCMFSTLPEKSSETHAEMAGRADAAAQSSH